MGTMIYGPQDVEFDDRLLTHLEIVIVNKFRRRESFLMSWLDDLSVGSGRSSLWMSAEVPVYFKYLGSRVPAVNRDWLRLLETEANGPRGLVVLDEDGAPAHAGRAGQQRPDRDAHPVRRVA
ncbi:DUF7882 family protein [Humibacter sp.]|jgi:hypothetical protein|uniref:DUF7882 family protein n=1 Tax=Humibacter sp. TaxID=1940291 RepID=UPI003F7F61DC